MQVENKQMKKHLLVQEKDIVSSCIKYFLSFYRSHIVILKCKELYTLNEIK